MERPRSRIIVDAQKQLGEAQQKTETSLQSARENYQRYFLRLLRRIKRSSSKPDTYIHIERDGAKTPERIVVNDVELSDLERYQFDAFPKHAVSCDFWRRNEVTVVIGEDGLTLDDAGIYPIKLMEVRLSPEPRITFEEIGFYTKDKQTLLESRDHSTKAQAFFELLSVVDSVIQRRLRTQTQKSTPATP